MATPMLVEVTSYDVFSHTRPIDSATQQLQVQIIIVAMDLFLASHSLCKMEVVSALSSAREGAHPPPAPSPSQWPSAMRVICPIIFV